jgi:hypothetical protein
VNTQDWAATLSTSPSEAGISTPANKKRKEKAKTPIIDDEVRRSSRLRKSENRKHYQLDKKPRRKKGAAKKSISIISVEDLQKAIINRSLDEDMDDTQVEAIPIAALEELGKSFCGVPPEEMNMVASIPQAED